MRSEINLFTGRIEQMDKQKDQKKRYDRSSLYYLAEVGQIGFTLVVPILMGIGIGRYIDQKFDLPSQGITGGIIIGSVLSLVILVRTIQDIMNEKI